MRETLVGYSTYQDEAIEASRVRDANGNVTWFQFETWKGGDLQFGGPTDDGSN